MAPNPYDLVRVDNGTTQFTTTRLIAESSDDLSIVRKPAVDNLGHALPALPKTNKAGEPITADQAAAQGEAPETANQTATSRKTTK